MYQSFLNKVIIVTGGAEGIGFEITKKFLEKGVKKLIILDINEIRGKTAAESLNAKYDNKVIFIKCDVTKDLDKTTDIIFKEVKTVDILVNNAGISEQGLTVTVDVNLTAVLDWTITFYEHMRKDKGGNGGTIINMASQAGYIELPIIPIYNATKWAVLGFTKSLGHMYNFNKTGVRVVAICPGKTNTSLYRNACPSVPKENRDEVLENFLKVGGWQEADAVGRAAGEVYEKAESGTVWEIVNNGPIQKVIHNVTKKTV